MQACRQGGRQQPSLARSRSWVECARHVRPNAVWFGCLSLFQTNNWEKTFDCPCHGSHFDRHGKVINGQSNTLLIGWMLWHQPLAC